MEAPCRSTPKRSRSVPSALDLVGATGGGLAPFALRKTPIRTAPRSACARSFARLDSQRLLELGLGERQRAARLQVMFAMAICANSFAVAEVRVVAAAAAASDEASRCQCKCRDFEDGSANNEHPVSFECSGVCQYSGFATARIRAFDGRRAHSGLLFSSRGATAAHAALRTSAHQ